MYTIHQCLWCAKFTLFMTLAGGLDETIKTLRQPTSRNTSARWLRLVLENASETLGILLLARQQGSGFAEWVSLGFSCQAMFQNLSVIWWCTQPSLQQHVIE
jgi:hypothetical protein